MQLETSVTELISILQCEIKSFSTLLELLIIEEKGLIDSDNYLLIDVLGRQEDLMSSIACLEKSRQELVGRIASLLELDADTLTITKISGYLNDPLRRELQETAHVLTEINENLKRKKTINTLLIRQGAFMVENNLRYLLKACGKDTANSGIYASDARRGNVSGSISLDGRV